MADQKSREKTPPCHECGAEVPKGANACPECGVQLKGQCGSCQREIRFDPKRKFCPHCGKELALVGTVVGGTVKPPRCSYCGKNLLHTGEVRCVSCGTYARKFEPLCPKCDRPVPPKANQCPACKASLFLSVSALRARLTHLWCTDCNQPAEELDDWAINHRIPFLFHTKKGVKTGWLPGGLENAASLYVKYFNVEGMGVEEAGRMLAKDDRPAWRFASKEAALAFAANFGCSCGGREWELSATRSIDAASRKAAKAAAPHVWRGLAWLVTKLGGVISGAIKELPKGRGR